MSQCQALVLGAAGDRCCRREGRHTDHIHGEGIVVSLCQPHHEKLHRSGLWLQLAEYSNWVHKQTRWCANCHPRRVLAAGEPRGPR